MIETLARHSRPHAWIAMSRLLAASGAAASMLALSLAVGGAQAAPATDPVTGAPAVNVRFGDLNLATTAGVQTLYRRIAAAAKEVCPQADFAELGRYAISRACQARAIERAVREVHDPRLAAVYERATHS